MNIKNNNPINSTELTHRKRTLSRLMAVQIFYQFEFLEQNNDYKTPIKEITNNIIDNYALTTQEEIKSYRNKIDETLIENLTNGVYIAKTELDNEIKLHLINNAKAEKTENLLEQILRFGAYELKFCNDIALKIIINEYLDITSFFFPEKQVKFVNFILENLAKKYRFEEFSKIKNKLL